MCVCMYVCVHGNFLEILEADLIIEGLGGLLGNFAEILSNLKDFRDLRTESLLDLNLLNSYIHFLNSDVLLTIFSCLLFLSKIGKMMKSRIKEDERETQIKWTIFFFFELKMDDK